MSARVLALQVTTVLALVSVSAGANTVIDDFDDGSINPSVWVHGGINRGNTGSPGGSWTSTRIESGSTLEMRVQGPASGITNGADAWIRTTYDYNDGQQHLIDFSWQPLVSENHFNGYQIQLTDGFIPSSAGVHWFQSTVLGTTNLLQRDGNLTWFFDESESGPPGLPLMDWSITIDPLGTASLYDGASGGGTLLATEILDTNFEWFLRFYIADATSSGFGAGDASFVLDSFSSTVIPEPSTALLLSLGLTFLGAGRRRIH